jgi:two-component system sensor histidine kinase CpxA
MAAAVLLCYPLAYYLDAAPCASWRRLQTLRQRRSSARVGSTPDELGHLARTFDRMANRIETLVTAERRLLLDISHERSLARLGVAVNGPVGRESGCRAQPSRRSPTA